MARLGLILRLAIAVLFIWFLASWTILPQVGICWPWRC